MKKTEFAEFENPLPIQMERNVKLRMAYRQK